MQKLLEQTVDDTIWEEIRGKKAMDRKKWKAEDKENLKQYIVHRKKCFIGLKDKSLTHDISLLKDFYVGHES